MGAAASPATCSTRRLAMDARQVPPGAAGRPAAGRAVRRGRRPGGGRQLPAGRRAGRGRQGRQAGADHRPGRPGTGRPWPARARRSSTTPARSHHQWFSCHTCHPDGHTCGRIFDTLNDDSFGNPKLTPTLRGVTRTGPWTWHGWQKDLGQAVEKSLTETLYGPKPTAEEVGRCSPSWRRWSHPPNPHRGPDGTPEPGGGARRGDLPAARPAAPAATRATDYTSAKNYDVKIERRRQPVRAVEPAVAARRLRPRAVPARRPGRDPGRGAEVAPRAGAAGRPALTPEERRDLIEFLKSL